MLAALEVLGIFATNVGSLEVPNEHLFEVGLATDVVWWEELEPRPDVLSHADRKIRDDEMVIYRTPSSAGEAEVLEPYSRAGIPRVLSNVHRRTEPLREGCPSNTGSEGLWSRAFSARALLLFVVTRAVRASRQDVLALDVRYGCIVHASGHLIDVSVVVGLLPRSDHAACVAVRAELASHLNARYRRLRVSLGVFMAPRAAGTRGP